MHSQVINNNNKKIFLTYSKTAKVLLLKEDTSYLGDIL